MRIPLFSWLFLMPICLLSISFCIPAVSGQCLGNQQSLLLQLKSSLAFDNRRSTKLVYWNQSVDCCLWEGVTCTQGRVIGLDLSYESIYGGLDFNSSSLFGLQHLQHLNLAYNDFSHRRIPSQFDKLKNLSYLNLSTAGFTGQIPIEISHLTRLVTLDLSTSFDFPPPLFSSVPFYIRPHRSLIFNSLKLENPNLNMLVQNLSELMGLYLDGVNISAQGSEWSEALSSSLPNLRVLSMSNCSLSGPLNSSLLNLQFLSIIRLDNNNFSGPVPESFGDFKNLTSLCFSSSGLNGKFPEKIFQIPTLQKLDLSSNELLQGSLPEFPLDGSLRTLMLSHTNFAGTLPSSIGNLKMLSLIDLMGCNFSGEIPNSIANLTQLCYLDISSNNFNGSIPSLSMGKNLIRIFLSNNDLTGPITSTQWEELLNLEILDLSHNSLEGSIPISLFSLPSLQDLTLRNNRFFGPLNEFSNVSSNLLNTLDLSYNNLTGPIPMSIFELQDLERLLLSSNNLEGSIPMSIFEPSKLTDLDLSDNQILGKIPNWIWKLQNLYTLNLSYNYLVTLDFPLLSISSLSVLDLRFNQLQLQGQLLIAPSSATYLDFSMNNFSGIIPASFGYSLVSTTFLSLSSNEFNGSIPGSICNAKHLLVLDLSNNSLSGTVPQCLIEMSVTQRVLGVLNLRNNNLTGAIYDVFGENCGFATLDLSGNQLEGKLPKSLAMCKQLEVLNIGNNHIKDAFPCYLKNIIMLRVLVLRSNEFYGLVGCPGPNVTWPMLQILDLASNNFTGRLPKQFFSNWSAMVAHEDTSQFELIHHDFHPFFSHVRFTTEKTQTYKEFRSTSIYYQDGVTITAKGLSMELVKILTIFTSIDLSCNNFVGPIPEEIGELKFLHMLNLSHNAFTGQIPSSLGKLSNLESLDLSNNELIGEIPGQLADGLTFLSFLNLSFNQLVGKIPQVKQFATFSETSYEGNTGLYGCPLKENCTHGEPRLTPPTIGETPSNSGNAIDWSLISVELGFVFGFATVVGPLLFWKKWRIYYYKHADDFFFKMFPKLYIRIENRRKRAHKNQGRRAH